MSSKSDKDNLKVRGYVYGKKNTLKRAYFTKKIEYAYGTWFKRTHAAIVGDYMLVWLTGWFVLRKVFYLFTDSIMVSVKNVHSLFKK